MSSTAARRPLRPVVLGPGFLPGLAARALARAGADAAMLEPPLRVDGMLSYKKTVKNNRREVTVNSQPVGR